ncbi:plasmolipin [Acipenser ruthenus]|uniref:plasmolipin n=1 Tax=Acipenser ruthenus TaxID=7906 RepID=UPI0027415D00|nr:plasmolipin [Acipenser ruthenus]
MDEFPAKVSTETSSQPTQSNSGFRGFSVGPVKMDVLFIRTIPGILMIVEIVLGLLVWALIAGTTYVNHAFGWVMFVSVTLWVITTSLFVVYLLSVPAKIQFVPWPIAMLIFNVIATVLYITAFITNAASVPTNWAPYYNNLAASAFFACLVMIAYCASSFFSFTAFRGQGSNAATNQATGSLPA